MGIISHASAPCNLAVSPSCTAVVPAVQALAAHDVSSLSSDSNVLFLSGPNILSSLSTSNGAASSLQQVPSGQAGPGAAHAEGEVLCTAYAAQLGAAAAARPPLPAIATEAAKARPRMPVVSAGNMVGTAAEVVATMQPQQAVLAACARGVRAPDMLDFSAADEAAALGTVALPAPVYSASLYVKNLPPDADKLFLYECFSPYGAIISVKVLADPKTGACRGVGFVNYQENASAKRAICALHNTKVGAENKLLHVSLQTPRTRTH